MSAEQELYEWLHGDHEVRALSIMVHAEADYGETDEHVTWFHNYEIKAHDTLIYGGDGDEEASVNVEYWAAGASIDEASALVLKMIRMPLS